MARHNVERGNVHGPRHELAAERPTGPDLVNQPDQWAGDYQVLSCDPLTVALEYNRGRNLGKVLAFCINVTYQGTGT